MLPVLPPHTAGLTEVIFPALIFGGEEFTRTVTVAAGDVQPATVWVTLMVYVPVISGTIVVVFVTDDTNPAFVLAVDHA